MFTTLLSLLGTAVIGIFAWSVQVGNRVTKLEAHEEDLPKLIEAKLQTLEAKADGIETRLARIESAMNGFLSGRH